MEADGLRRLALKIPARATHTSARPRSMAEPVGSPEKVLAALRRGWSGARGRHSAVRPEARGPRRAEAKAPFPNVVGRKPPLTQRRSGSSAPFIEDDLRPTDVRERPGALAGARARRSRRGPRRGRPLSPRGPRRPCSKEPPEMGRTRMGFSAGAIPLVRRARSLATKQPPVTTIGPQARQ